MTERHAAVSIICPGLLGPLPALPQPLPETPCLDRLLARAKPIADGSLDPFEACLAAFGIASAPDQDLPTGPLALLGDAPNTDIDGFWMHADPVHLRPDRDRLLVFADASIASDRDEADALVEAFNRHFAADGLHLVAPTPRRWYLRVERAPRVRTSPLYRVLGASMAAYVPHGPDALPWMRFLNEVQMLFHSHAVNTQRESLGRPMINGFWTWGGGYRPSVSGHPPELVLGDHPVLAGLARLAGGVQQTLDALSDSPTLCLPHALVFADAPWSALLARDLAGWTQALSDLDGVLSAVFRGGNAPLLLDPCLGTRLSVKPRGVRLFWRSKGLARWLEISQ